jgi:hypothetical protein
VRVQGEAYGTADATLTRPMFDAVVAAQLVNHEKAASGFSQFAADSLNARAGAGTAAGVPADSARGVASQ